MKSIMISIVVARVFPREFVILANRGQAEIKDNVQFCYVIFRNFIKFSRLTDVLDLAWVFAFNEFGI